MLTSSHNQPTPEKVVSPSSAQLICGRALTWQLRRWESGYWASMDIAHDRAGYYLCWGCLNWVPAIYTSPALALVKPAVHLGPALSAAILVAGAASVLINYDSDRQRQVRPGGWA